MRDYQLQPPRVLLMGPPGSGKTYSISTLLECGIKTYVIVTEPDGIASLLDAVERKKLPIEHLHWSYCPAASQGWQSLLALGEKIGSSTYEQLAQDKTGVGKQYTREAGMKFLNTLANFHCDRTNTDFGPVDKFGADSALVLDSMSGFNMIALMLTIGHKSNPQQGEWGVAMNFCEQLLLKLNSDLSCFFIVTAHPDREFYEAEGRSFLTVGMLGKKLAPKVTRFFSEIVLAKRTVEGNRGIFTWSTASADADLKNRALPLAPVLPADFRPIIQAYHRRLELAGLTPAATAPSEPVRASPSLQPTLTK